MMHDLPQAVIQDSLLPLLNAQDQRSSELTFRSFREPCQERRQALASMLYKTVQLANSLATYGIAPPTDQNSTTDVAEFLSQTAQCIDKVNNTLPIDLKSPLPARDLIHIADLKSINNLLTAGTEFTLQKRVIRELKYVALDATVGSVTAGLGGTVGAGVGALIGWKSLLRGTIIPVAQPIGSMGGVCGVLTPLATAFTRPQTIGLKRVFLLVVQVAGWTLIGHIGEVQPTLKRAISAAVICGALFSSLIGEVERRWK